MLVISLSNIFFKGPISLRMIKLISILIFSTTSAFALGIKGKVYVPQQCGEAQAMVWLSKVAEEFSKQELLMHTMVPHEGSYEFYVKPGQYRIVASTSLGCEVSQNVYVSHKSARIDFVLTDKKSAVKR
jgi:hypothetical protein